ncbi:MAG: hypothetical protein V2A72_07485 [Candidatus Omnitrophota bacterium]
MSEGVFPGHDFDTRVIEPYKLVLPEDIIATFPREITLFTENNRKIILKKQNDSFFNNNQVGYDIYFNDEIIRSICWQKTKGLFIVSGKPVHPGPVYITINIGASKLTIERLDLGQYRWWAGLEFPILAYFADKAYQHKLRLHTRGTQIQTLRYLSLVSDFDLDGAIKEKITSNAQHNTDNLRLIKRGMGHNNLKSAKLVFVTTAKSATLLGYNKELNVYYTLNVSGYNTSWMTFIEDEYGNIVVHDVGGKDITGYQRHVFRGKYLRAFKFSTNGTFSINGEFTGYALEIDNTSIEALVKPKPATKIVSFSGKPYRLPDASLTCPYAIREPVPVEASA